MNSLEERWKGEQSQIAELQFKGHTYFCAGMMIFLDGECECGLKKKKEEEKNNGKSQTE